MAEQQEGPQQSGFDALGQQARQDFRMGTDAKRYTQDEARVLVEELGNYQAAQQVEQGGPLSQAALAGRLGMSASALSELRGWALEGKPCRLDTDKALRRIDSFQANEAARSGRLEAREFVQLSITAKIFGVYRAAVRHNTMGVVIAQPGSCKTMHARAIAAEHEGGVYVRICETEGNARGVSRVLCEARRLPTDERHPQRLARLKADLRRHRNLLIVIDEAQKLRGDGLEMLRDLYDSSDPEGRRNTPMLFFGDAGFLRLITKARNGEVCAVRPQLTRRMAPVFCVETDGGSDGSGAVFTEEDIRRVLRNQRVKLVSERGIRWLASLSNVDGYGSLGFAVMVVRMAADIAQRRPLDTEDLQRALKMLLGPRATEDVDQLAGGTLLRAVG